MASLFDDLLTGLQNVAAVPVQVLNRDLSRWEQWMPGLTAPASPTGVAGQSPDGADPSSLFLRGPFLRAVNALGQTLDRPFVGQTQTGQTQTGQPQGGQAQGGQAQGGQAQGGRAQAGQAAATPPALVVGPAATAPAQTAAPAPGGAPAASAAPPAVPGVAPAAASAALAFPAAQPTAQPTLFTLPVLSPQDARQLPSGQHFVTSDLQRVLRRT
jgi:hypothetical protein